MRRQAVPTILACVTFAAALALPSAAAAWAPASTAKVHPGMQVFTKGAQCTANFVYKANGNTFLGQAAHCSGKGEASDTNGCKTESLPIGTKVRLQGRKQRGELVYSSWNAMNKVDEQSKAACRFNDLALIKLRPAHIKRTNPSLPFWGGPTGLGPAKDGGKVYTYGNSSLRGGNKETGPRRGTVLQREAKGWSYDVRTDQPGVPGDSGSGFLNGTGKALGVLSTVRAGIPSGVSNGVGDLTRELSYARKHSRFDDLRVAKGTEPFTPNKTIPLTTLGG